MSFDISRLTFNPLKNYFGVVMEQGRVQLDSDWNEFLAEVARRIQAGTMDIVGLAGVPSTTPWAFSIGAYMDTSQTPNIPHVTIGAGRMYVDGLLAENHGPAAAVPSPLVWDPALAEMSATPQTQGAVEVLTDYAQQPYLPLASLTLAQVTGKQFLFYLDAWQREVTWLEDLSLIEKAVGIDTTGRLQTVWQVKWCDVTPAVAGVTVYASTPDFAIPPYAALIQPSPARLTTGSGGASPAPSGPCALSPATGYTGMENQLYRVQIHQGGSASPSPAVTPPASTTATFKWSRDNASVSTAVTAISAAPVANSVGNPASQITVQSMGRDQTLGFSPGDWIEITADYLELNGLAGELHQIDSINAAAKTLLLDSVVAANLIAASSLTPPSQNVRIRRWDQAGIVYLADGATVWVNLNASGSAGIPVPPSGTTLILENGITAAFDLDPSGNAFFTGDYWLTAARTADASVDALKLCPPVGIHHHYCRLGVVDFTGTPPKVTDCRPTLPPLASRCIHVIGLSYGGVALPKDAQVSLQSLAGGIAVQFDIPLDPAIVTSPGSTTGNCPVIRVAVDFPGAAASGGLFTSTTIPAIVSVGAPPNDTLTWTPTSTAFSGLASLPAGPPMLTRLTIKGDSVWALDNRKTRLDGAGCGRASDFETWFWLIPQPIVTLSASSVNFLNPQTVGGGAGAAQTVTLTNHGTSALTIALVTTGDFAASGCTPTVAANSNCVISITFNPTASGTRTGSVTVNYSGAATGSLPITITGTGVAPGVTFTPTFLTFPLQTAGTVSAEQSITVNSTGSSQLTISAVAITGPFSQTNNVVGNLQSGASGSIEVQFRPLAAGSFAGPLVITHNAAGSPTTIQLSGTGQAAVPAITASSTSLTFRGAGTINVTLTSTGTAPLSITSIAITGTTAVFSQTNTLGTGTLAPNAQCVVSVKCTPPAATSAVATLVITHNAAGSPLNIPLSYTSVKLTDKVSIDIKITDKIVFQPKDLNAPVEPSESTSGTMRSFIAPEERPELGPQSLEKADTEVPGEEHENPDKE